jgi:hypothetical protein
MLTVASQAQPPLPEHEIKLVTPAARADLVTAWLAGRCRPDPRHPRSLVTSIYFDNRAALLLRAKLNSDFIKHKVRVRWYADPDTGVVEEPAFLEIKRKIGGRRFKRRIALRPGSAALAAGRPPASRLRALLACLRAEGHWAEADLQPFLRIAFRRRRFLDPDSGSRVSLDRDIRADCINPGLLPQRHPAPLAHAVIEVKGARGVLPASLMPLRALGCVPASFSKYARAYQKVARRSSF